MTRFWRTFGGAARRPARTFEALQTDPRQVALGVQAMLAVGVLQTITAGMLAAGGAFVSMPAFIHLPSEDYYFYELFFALPVFLLGWVMAAGFARVLGPARRGRGTFEGTLAALGFAFAIPLFIAWIPEMAFAVLILLGMPQQEFMAFSVEPGLVQTVIIAYQVVAAVWFLGLTVLAVRSGMRLRWGRAVVVGVLSAALFLGTMVLFIR